MTQGPLICPPAGGSQSPAAAQKSHRMFCPICQKHLLVLSEEELKPPPEDDIFLEYEKPLLEYCKHRRRDTLEKNLSGALLYGRYLVENVKKAIPHYSVVMSCQDHAKEAKGHREVWAKFVWNVPRHKSHGAFIREFYLLQFLGEHQIASVPMVRTFDANSNAKIAMGIMDALHGHLLEEELPEYMQGRAQTPAEQGGRPPRSSERAKRKNARAKSPPTRPSTTEVGKAGTDINSRRTLSPELDLESTTKIQDERRLGITAFRALHVADELLRCLAECHTLGVVCGDVRPGSILMEDYGFDGKTSLKVLDWGHGWVKDPKTALGDKYAKDMHRISVNLARNIQNAIQDGVFGWSDQSISELKRRLEYMSTEHFEQLADSAKEPLVEDDTLVSSFGGLEMQQLLDKVDRSRASDPKEETDVFMAGVTILQCFRGGLEPTKSSQRADLISATQRWIQGALPRDGELMDALIDAINASKQAAGISAVHAALIPRRHPGIESVLAKALQSQREQRYASLQDFHEALAAETMPSAVEDDFMMLHKRALADQLSYYPLTMGLLTMPQIWRALDVLTRIPRPAFTHVTVQGFDADTPPEVIRQFAWLFAKNPEPNYVDWQPLQVYWLGIEFPCECLKIEWRDLVAARVCEFIFLLIRRLDLSGSNVDLNVDVMASCLGNHECTIDVIDLSSCRMFDKNALVFVPAISNTPRLQMLNLANNSLTDLSVLALVEALVQNSSVRFLNLAENSLSRKSALALAGLFGDPDASENTSGERRRIAPLESLELRQNCLVGGGISLGRALRPSASGECPLRYLGLNNNGLNEQDAMALASGIGVDGSLNVLHIGGNPLGRRGIRALLEAVVHTLTTDTLPELQNPASPILPANETTVSIAECTEGMPQHEEASFPESRVLESLDIANNGVQEDIPHEWLRSIFHEIDALGQLKIQDEESVPDSLVPGKTTVQLRHLVSPAGPTVGYPQWPYDNRPMWHAPFRIWTE